MGREQIIHIGHGIDPVVAERKHKRKLHTQRARLGRHSVGGVGRLPVLIHRLVSFQIHLHRLYVVTQVALRVIKKDIQTRQLPHGITLGGHSALAVTLALKFHAVRPALAVVAGQGLDHGRKTHLGRHLRLPFGYHVGASRQNRLVGTRMNRRRHRTPHHGAPHTQYLVANKLLHLYPQTLCTNSSEERHPPRSYSCQNNGQSQYRRKTPDSPPGSAPQPDIC